MQRQFNTILIVTIVVLSTALLVGLRFDAQWAGGDGYSSQGVAVVDGIDYQRGETISTGENEWLEVTIGPNTVWMYENTELKLIDLSEDNLELTVVQGRIVLYGRVTMRIRDNTELLDGLSSYVH